MFKFVTDHTCRELGLVVPKDVCKVSTQNGFLDAVKLISEQKLSSVAVISGNDSTFKGKISSRDVIRLVYITSKHKNVATK